MCGQCSPAYAQAERLGKNLADQALFGSCRCKRALGFGAGVIAAASAPSVWRAVLKREQTRQTAKLFAVSSATDRAIARVAGETHAIPSFG
jgi:hypothetical protein